MKVVFKILTLPEWDELDSKGTFLGSVADGRDGFIHFSTAEQAEATVARHFPDAGELVLVAVDVNAVGVSLRWETSRGGGLFPHLYRPLGSSDVLWATRFDARRPTELRKLLAA